MENSVAVFQNLRIKLSYDPAIPLLSTHPENRDSKKYLYPHVHSSIIHNSQKVEATPVSVDRWMDKQNVVIYIPWKYLTF